jgi:hypothetical protein
LSSDWKGLEQRVILALVMGWTAAIASIQTHKRDTTTVEREAVEFRFNN